MIKFKVIDYSCRLSIKFSPFDRFFYIIRQLLTYIINFMPITIHPKAGQLLLCDFSKGFREPEMVKASHPVIILSGFIPGRKNLATIVSCSTVKPDIVRNYHYKLPDQSTPKSKHFMGRDTWVKGDMVYTVAYHRLDLIYLSKNREG